jgi:signal transduction histidine kinase
MIAWNNLTLRHDSGAVIGSASIGEDITQRVSLQEQLIQSQKMESLGSLAGGVAHDFNNILTGGLGYAQLAELKVDPRSPIQKDLQEIQHAAKRGADLTKQLLTFARKELVEPEILSVNDVVVGLHGLLDRLLGETVSLTLALDSDLGKVKIDPSQFEQVIVNLAVNARDAMPKGGKLLIESHNVVVERPLKLNDDVLEPATYIVVSVSDDGCGIPRAIQSQVFDPFFTTKEKGKGTGLGLATCYGIIRTASGHIRLYSEPGTGTTFRIYLPRTDQAETPKDGLPAICPSGIETILVVEDEDSVRAITTQLLSATGYTVLEAQDGQAALALVTDHEGQIDLLITDVIMPGMSGRELSEALQHIRPELKTIYMSGYTDDAIVHMGVLEQHYAFLQKPFVSAKLYQKVRDVLDLRVAQ